jgi:hypothetical protein
MFGIKYLPSLLVTAKYFVPDGECTDTIVAPGKDSPVSLTTLPDNPEVVTPCEYVSPKDISKINKDKTPCNRFFFIVFVFLIIYLFVNL